MCNKLVESYFALLNSLREALVGTHKKIISWRFYQSWVNTF
jgi:hypothetical protein